MVGRPASRTPSSVLDHVRPGHQRDDRQAPAPREGGALPRRGKREEPRQLVYALDLAYALAEAAFRPGLDGAEFICTYREPISIRELSRLAGRVAGRAVPSFRVPLPVAVAAGLAFETLEKLGFRFPGGESPVTREKLQTVTVDRAYRIDRMRDLLGWEPPTSYEKGFGGPQPPRSSGRGSGRRPRPLSRRWRGRARTAYERWASTSSGTDPLEISTALKGLSTGWRYPGLHLIRREGGRRDRPPAGRRGCRRRRGLPPAGLEASGRPGLGQWPDGMFDLSSP
jgi:hypothetical protein